MIWTKWIKGFLNKITIFVKNNKHLLKNDASRKANKNKLK